MPQMSRLSDLEYLRRSEEIDDVETKIRNLLDDPERNRRRLLQLRAQAVALLERLKNDLP